MFLFIKNIYSYNKLFFWSLILIFQLKYNINSINTQNILLKNINNCGSTITKFTQLLVPLLDLIKTDKKIIDFLSRVYEHNFYHSDNITFKKFKNEYGFEFMDKYKIVNKVSSASMGQVYKIREIESNNIYAMKVLHPNLKNDIYFNEGFINILLYLFDKNIPIDIRHILNLIKLQTDLNDEAKNMKMFYNLYKDNNNILIPNIISSTKNILIMEYIDGIKINELDLYNKNKFMSLLKLFMHRNKYKLNFNHGDLHVGNWKIIKEINSIIIYDFGLCWSLKNDKYLIIIDSSLHYLNDDEFITNQVENIKELLRISEIEITIEVDNYINKLFNYKISNYKDFIDNLVILYKLMKKKLNNDFLNIIISYCFTIIYDDTNYIDMVSICETYNIFDDIKDDLKLKINLTKDNYNNIFDKYSYLINKI
jgi:predicted unusual protein kinase regulating ubiquinone biosynthesis (AarF/ABC1/UbiB family)